MLKKYLYPIVKNKKLKNWLKFWYLQGQKVAIKLIKLLDITSPVALNNTIKDTHIKIDILGNTSQDGTPTPENEVPIHVVKGHNEFLIQSKNWFDGIWGLIEWRIDTGEKWDNRTDRIGCNDYIKVEPSTTYTLSFKRPGTVYLLEYDKNKTYLNKYTRLIYHTLNGTITLGETTEYITFYYIPYNHELSLNEECQLELGTTATSYVPYEEQTLELDLPEGMEMCKIGDYADTFEKQDGKWYKIPKIIKEIINANTSFYNEKRTNENEFRFIFPNRTSSTNVNNYVLCNYYKNIIVFADYSIVNIYERSVWINNPFDSNFPSEMTTNEAKAKFHELYDNKLIFYTVDTRQTAIEITDETLVSQLNALQKAKAYDEQTNIIITAEDLEPKLNVEYLEKEVIS